MFDQQLQSWADGPGANTFQHAENELENTQKSETKGGGQTVSVSSENLAALTTVFDQRNHCQRTAGYAWQKRPLRETHLGSK